MIKILVTAFEPFGRDAVNPTEAIVEALPDHIPAENDFESDSENGAALIKLVLPVSFIDAQSIVCREIAKNAPDIVISLGLAGGRAAVTVERVAINCMDARMPDNTGYLPADLPVIKDAPAAYFSTLPIKKIAKSITSEGISSAVSNSAGTYVCNTVMYRILHAAASMDRKMLCGFIHVPYIDSMNKEPAMSLDDEIRAVKAAIRACIE